MTQTVPRAEATQPSPAAPAGGGPAPPRVRATWRALRGYIRPYRAPIALGGLLNLAAALLVLAQPLVAKALVDALGRDGPVTGIVLGLTGLVFLGMLVRAAGQYVLERAAESITRDARRQLAARLMRLRVAEMDRSRPGDLMSRVIADTTLLRQVTTQALVSAVIGGLTLVATVVLMAVLDAPLLGVCLAAVVLIGCCVTLIMPRIAHATRRVQESVGAAATVLERAFGAFRTIKAAGAEAREAAALDEAVDEAWHGGVRVAGLRSVASSATGFAVHVAFLAVLGVGGARVASGAVELSTLIAFLLLTFQLASPVGQLVEAAAQYQAGSAAVFRIQQAQGMDVEQPSPGRPGTRRCPATVEFRRVDFRYRAELPQVHRDLSFRAEGPGTTAFVGPSGAGKTTVFALIERFYEAVGGTVLVNGIDVLDWPLAGLRASIGYVEQDAPLLAGTLRDNLTCAAPDVTDDDIRDTLARVQLDALVDRLPDGLDASVGHRGNALSGGERQRVAIARALLRRPALLLLDEATSQLDAVNERVLRDVVADIARDTTVLVIAHRLSTVATADQIVVLEGGRVRRTGTHRELVEGDALYAELAATQLLAEPGARRPDASYGARRA
ncbi:ABC transporter ATP-binding protein [Streptomyces iconiensis]|uniref:ABC transporter ATP-binding protein n=1 Tax=Streptomyces iconiensis TaxID=1384038 RepID=A0ABT7A0L3_9ACTN|nr:ABC transporter ATP-binding protein [Streptomyces iconiensis]MDJ1134873.1 ABC transporter ATP-binding protein [Streptomyces iconiensis]